MPRINIATFEDLLSKAKRGDEQASIDLQFFFDEDFGAAQLREFSMRLEKAYYEQPDNPYFVSLMGFINYNGFAGFVDFEKAKLFYQCGVELGCPYAMMNRAFMHQFGKGGPIDLDAAIALLKKAYLTTTQKVLCTKIIKRLTELAQEHSEAAKFLAYLYCSGDPAILTGTYHTKIHAAILQRIANKKDFVDLPQYFSLLTQYAASNANAVLTLLKQKYNDCNLGIYIALSGDSALVKRYLDFLTNVEINISDKLALLEEQGTYVCSLTGYKIIRNLGMIVVNHGEEAIKQYLSLLNKFAETHGNNVLQLLHQRDGWGFLFDEILSLYHLNTIAPTSYIQLLTKLARQGHEIDKNLLRNCESYKETIYNCINNLPLTEKLKACAAALDPDHSLGKIMRIKRGLRKPNLNRGTLKKIVLLQNAAKKQANSMILIPFLEAMNKQCIAGDNQKKFLTEQKTTADQNLAQPSYANAHLDYSAYLNYQNEAVTQVSSAYEKNVASEFPFLQALIDGSSFPAPIINDDDAKKIVSCTNQTVIKNSDDTIELSQNNLIDLSSECPSELEKPMVAEKAVIPETKSKLILSNAVNATLFSHSKNDHERNIKLVIENRKEKSIVEPKEKSNRKKVLA